MRTTAPQPAGSGDEQADGLVRPRRILPVIVAAQFAGTSLWFAGNAVLGDLQGAYGLPATALGPLTSAVQIGFIAGTLAYAVATIADRFSPSRVFLLSALAGAVVNLGVGTVATDYAWILAFRFLTGFFLAGIYPVGMKLAADWFEAGLGRALGWLVGALVLGTAFPHLLAAGTADLPWQTVVVGTSALAALGGVAVWALVPDGPYRSASRGFRPGAIAAVFRVAAFRSAALGYFGHMWELYAMWAWIGSFLLASFERSGVVGAQRWAALAAFAVIAIGALGAVLAGARADRAGRSRTAAAALGWSGASAVAIGLTFGRSPWLVLAVGLIWGVSVIADSALFSTIVTDVADQRYVGTAVTLQLALGFVLTVATIWIVPLLVAAVGWSWAFLVLVPGPVLGIAALRALERDEARPAPASLGT